MFASNRPNQIYLVMDAGTPVVITSDVGGCVSKLWRVCLKKSQ